MTNKLNSSEKVLNDINQTDAEKNQKKRFRNAVAATALVAAGAVGLGVAGENDRQAEQLTNQNNEYILDQAEEAGSKGSAEGHEVPAWIDEINAPNADPDGSKTITPEDVAAEDVMIVGNDGDKAVEAERAANDEG